MSGCACMYVCARVMHTAVSGCAFAWMCVSHIRHTGVSGCVCMYVCARVRHTGVSGSACTGAFICVEPSLSGVFFDLFPLSILRQCLSLG